MTNYVTALKTWGSTGVEYPDGWAYLEGEEPPDDWDNFLISNLVKDIKDHLIPLTNTRLDSSTGLTKPASPTGGEIFWESDAGNAWIWDGTEGVWEEFVLKTDADATYSPIGHNHDDRYVNDTGDTMTGVLNMDAAIVMTDETGTNFSRNIAFENSTTNPQVYLEYAVDEWQLVNASNSKKLIRVDTSGNVYIPNGSLFVQGTKIN